MNDNDVLGRTGSLLDGYLARPALAREIGKSERTITRFMHEKDGLPFVRIGRTPYFRIASVRVWLDRRETQMNPTTRKHRSAA